MLVERGAISVEQLHTGLAACRRGGARLGTYLVDYGFIEEDSLLQALAEQHGVPYVSQQMLLEYLEGVDAGVLPKSMLRRLRVVPFRLIQDRIQVAMSNPGDARIIDRIANFTQMHVEPFVASDRTIELAIDRARDTPPAAGEDADLLTEVVAAEEDKLEWDDLWKPRMIPATLFRHHSRPRAAKMVHVASFPSLVPAGSDGGKLRGAITDNRELLRLFGSATTASEVGEILVHYTSQRCDRVCLFAVHHGKVSGWMSRGIPLDAADVRSFSIFADVASVFTELEERDRYAGPMPAGVVNDDLLRLLGHPEPTEVLVVSLPMNGRAKGYVMADLPTRSVPVAIQDELVSAGRAAGETLAAVLRGRG